jgi:hypothetical protein
MRNIKLKYVWLSIVLAFVLSCVFIYLCSITEGALLTFIIVLLVITFIYMTVAVQYASFKTFKYKPKKIIYPTIKYEGDLENIEATLKKNGFKERIVPYGLSYLKIKNRVAYKVVLVKEEDKYFNQEDQEQQNTPVNKELEKCTKFMGAEIFLNISEENLYRLPDFSIQGKNIYYTAYYTSGNELICLNYLEPNEEYKEPYNNLISDLKLNKKNEEENEE